MRIKNAIQAASNENLEQLLKGLSSWNGEFWDTGVSEALGISVADLFDFLDAEDINLYQVLQEELEARRKTRE